LMRDFESREDEKCFEISPRQPKKNKGQRTRCGGRLICADKIRDVS